MASASAEDSRPWVAAVRIAARAFYSAPYDSARVKEQQEQRSRAAKGGALSAAGGPAGLVAGSSAADEREKVLPSSSKALILAQRASDARAALARGVRAAPAARAARNCSSR